MVSTECIIHLGFVFSFQGGRGGVGTKGERGEKGEKVNSTQALNDIDFITVYWSLGLARNKREKRS